MSFYTYVIASTNPSLKTYVGWTTDIKKRLAKHNSGKGAKSTRGRNWKLIYKEKFDTKTKAMKREYKIKKDQSFRNKLRNKI
ncbi:MAG: hypothetical protein CBC24_06505 [Candidatus Pelagibacter sp. TMED64]|nr:excinuclease ABC subunit C [Candidatus Pelagibacter sp.]OUU64871.1 MAG: hypothetical protein CBC24_06505 [Candidatus Pelagibacter sp. TMED64]|tara:strand:- start:1579 stop:1824 length:246 start_codon:yes stop_codon:yes gene_type:complete